MIKKKHIVEKIKKITLLSFLGQGCFDRMR